jgi:NAD(P)-dependent dehydrogenase (short-subunit alcohol dehydrogenase family)
MSTDSHSVLVTGATARPVVSDARMMPPQMSPANDGLPPSDTWRTLFQRSFIGPLGLLKAVIPAMQPDPAQGQRVKIVIISAVTSVQALGNYATNNVLRCTPPRNGWTPMPCPCGTAGQWGSCCSLE